MPRKTTVLKIMNPPLIIALVFASGFLAHAEEENKSIPVTPKLEATFAKIIEIEGKVVNDIDTRRRSDLGKKLIEIYHIGERALKVPIVIELSVFSFTDIKIPGRGSWVRFRGYETGGFTGIPREAFKDIPQVATTNHHFESRFQVTKSLKPKRAK